jgi:exosortase family protein XrtM
MKKYLPLVKFFGIFISVVAVYYLLVSFYPSAIDFYINATAGISASILTMLGIETYAQGNNIISDEMIISLAFGCEGSEPIVLFIAAVSAFPSNLKKKLVGGITGVLLLYVLNIIRIIMLYFIGLSEVFDFDLFHVIIFPVIFIIISILFFIGWLRWQNDISSKA